MSGPSALADERTLATASYGSLQNRMGGIRPNPEASDRKVYIECMEELQQWRLSLIHAIAAGKHGSQLQAKRLKPQIQITVSVAGRGKGDQRTIRRECRIRR